MKASELTKVLRLLKVKHQGYQDTVFSCVQVEKYSLMVTDIEVWTTIEVPEGTGIAKPTCYPLNYLYNAVKEFPSEADVEFGSNSVRWQGIPPVEMSAMPGDRMPGPGKSGKESHSFLLNVNSLKEAKLFSDEEDVRYYLNGVFFDTDNCLIKATDGHRLFQTELIKTPEVKPFIMRGCQVEKVCSVFKSGEVTVETDGDTVQVYRGGVSVLSKRLDGMFPQTERVVPKTHDLTVSLNAEEFYEALENIGKDKDQEYKRVQLRIKGDFVSLHSTSGEFDRFIYSRTAMNIKNLKKTAVFNFNYKYILDVMKVVNRRGLESLELLFTFDEKILTPCKIVTEKDTFVVMPMKG